MLACAIDRHQLAADIKAKGRALGFELVGIAPAHAIESADYFRAWLDAGKHGAMRYLARRFAERTNPDVYLAGAKTVICLAINYNNDAPPSPCTRGEGGGEGLTSKSGGLAIAKPPSPQPSPRVQGEGGSDLVGQVARYARGDDYHELLKDRLYKLADWIRQTVPGCQTKCGVDTAPIMEKPLAARAGIGWQGKNTLLIHPRIGSWLLLGEILTTLELPTDLPMIDHCGTCTRCIDACPTQAITPYQLDATKCISYWNIETTHEIPESIQAQMGDRLFGCDICQEVCPFNRQAPLTQEPAFESRLDGDGLEIDEILKWQLPDYSARLHNSPIKRVKLAILQRNAAKPYVKRAIWRASLCDASCLPRRKRRQRLPPSNR